MATHLLILGSGSFAVEALDIAEATGGFEPIGFVNSVDPDSHDTRLEGLPVWWIDRLPETPPGCHVIAGIVSPRRRDIVNAMAARGYPFATLVHPSATVSKRSTLAPGCVVHPGVIVAANTAIGSHVVLNRGCLVGHDNRIGSFTSIGPGANLAGAVLVGERVFVGVGAVVRDHLVIGDDAVVAAGAVVVRSVSPGTTVMGVPAVAAGSDRT
jgi:acetyltransferase EpsM